jgi:hypothetical protein
MDCFAVILVTASINTRYFSSTVTERLAFVTFIEELWLLLKLVNEHTHSDIFCVARSCSALKGHVEDRNPMYLPSRFTGTDLSLRNHAISECDVCYRKLGYCISSVSEL